MSVSFSPHPHKRRIDSDTILTRIVGVYWLYFVPIRGRAREGRQVMLRSFAAVLRHQGQLDVREIGPDPKIPYDPATGAGYLLVENRYRVDVTCVEELTPRKIARGRKKSGYGPNSYCLLNFGSDAPEWHIPFEASLERWQEGERLRVGYWGEAYLDEDEYDDDDGGDDKDDEFGGEEADDCPEPADPRQHKLPL